MAWGWRRGEPSGAWTDTIIDPFKGDQSVMGGLVKTCAWHGLHRAATQARAPELERSELARDEGVSRPFWIDGE